LGRLGPILSIKSSLKNIWPRVRSFPAEILEHIPKRPLSPALGRATPYQSEKALRSMMDRDLVSDSISAVVRQGERGSTIISMLLSGEKKILPPRELGGIKL